MTITTFTLPTELKNIAECNLYIDLCSKRRDSYSKLPGAPNKIKIGKAWNHRIHAAKVQRERFVKGELVEQ